MNEEIRQDDTIELIEHRAMVCLPESAVKVVMNVDIYYDGQIVHVEKTMDIADIRDAFQKADDGYIDENDRFTITPAGLKYLEEHKQDT